MKYLLFIFISFVVAAFIINKIEERRDKIITNFGWNIGIAAVVFIILIKVFPTSPENSTSYKSNGYNSSSDYEEEYHYDEDEYNDEGTFDDYYDEDEEDIPEWVWVETPDSSCFTEIGYNEREEVLYVNFRETGDSYLYFDFPDGEWVEFLIADSKGGWFNENIKPYYEYSKVA